MINGINLNDQVQNQITNGARPFPTLSSDSPILPGAKLGNITEVTSLGYSRHGTVAPCTCFSA